jgi:plastocyanin
MKRFAFSAALFIAGCTPGALTPNSSAGGAALTTIDVNLTLHAGGYAPNPISVPVGSTIRFTNSDGFTHTATLIPNATAFPAGSPFTLAALTKSGDAVSQDWSTGALAAGASSQTIAIDKAGTYFYGCFYHYGAPMQGTIVAQ